MIHHVNLSLCLICHHEEPYEVLKDAQVIHEVSIKRRVPITYAISGKELNALGRNRDWIRHELGVDLIGEMQSDNYFINPRLRNNGPYKSELCMMPSNHAMLVQPWSQDIWSEYFREFIEEQIRWSRDRAEQVFHKTPVTIHPPDGVYAPAVAYTLKKLGLDTVIVSGEFLGENRHAKGVLYWASNLRHLMRTNDIQPQYPAFYHARDFVNTIENYGHRHDVGFVVTSCDIDEFNGMRNLSIYDGIARLCCIGDETYEHQGVSMVNCNAAAHWNLFQEPIENVWPWNNVYAQIRGNGNLDWIDPHRNEKIGRLIQLAIQRRDQGWNIRQAKNHIHTALDSALRNRDFCYEGWLPECFDNNTNEAMRLLQG